ncbi:hypothetical protein HNQ56_000127 [Anaerotaenia torta]|uniref:ABC transporter substrate-binding protein n=1 Tax=Anaerotaenia torta TaxID=433293 RepID=UPI003D256DEA
MKKQLCIFLSVVIALGWLTGCGRREAEVANKEKTQLTIGVFDGGLGSEWVYTLKKRFEKKYEETSFEEGKKGVEIRVTESAAFTQTGMENNIDSFNENIIFAEGASATYFAKKGNFLDVTDVATKPLSYDFVTGETDSQAAETSTVESKLSEAQKEYYSAIEGKYYALPTTEKFFGIAYDIELFEENNLFFAPDGSFVKDKDAARSGGPDGREETVYDNGLPATYDQFFELCDRILSLDPNLIPVMWGGNVQEYVNSLLIALAADYEGVEQMELNYNYDGVMSHHVSSVDESGAPVISSDPIAITAENGYELYKLPGRYYALKFIERLVSNPGYYNNKTATSTSFTHKDAQGQFVMGKYSEKIQRAAMLIDGNWWQSEAKGVFNDLAAQHGEEASVKNRRFGLMPLPKVKEAGEYTILQLTGDIAFINAKTPAEKVNLAKAFLQFCYTEESLVEYTTVTNVCRAVDYEMGDKKEELSAWGKTMVDMHENARKAIQDSASPMMQNYSTDLWYSPRLWLSTVNGETFTYPATAMINENIKAEDYFEGLSAYWTESVWKNHFKSVQKGR